MAGLEFAGRGRATPADAPRPRSLAETAYDAIEQMIISRRLAPGAMVSEGELGAELGLGRTPVREALARLKTIGFVEVHPRRGVLVTQVDIIKHLELLEVRRPLDETVARCAIARATEADVARLLDCVGGLRSTGEGPFSWSLSASYGKNATRFVLNESINASLGPDSPTSFDLGQMQQRELNFNADAVWRVPVGLAEPLNLAFGAESRKETYEMITGDPASYAVGPGAQFGLAPASASRASTSP